MRPSAKPLASRKPRTAKPAAKTSAPAAAAAPRATARRATATPAATPRPTAKPTRNTEPARPRDTPRRKVPAAGYAAPDSRAGQPSGSAGAELISTTIQAAAELAQIGLTVGRQTLQSMLDRLPKP